MKNNRGTKYQKKEMKRGKKHSDKLVKCVANSLLDLKLRVAYRHIFPE